MLVLVSCNLEEDKVEDAKRLKFEMENRKLKKISEAEIFTLAYSKGDEIVKRVGDSLKTHLIGAIKNGGVLEAIKYCNVEAMPLTSKISKHLFAKIRRVSHKNRNIENAPNTDLEKQILEAYQYNVDNKESVASNVQISDDLILYTSPIMVGPLCLNCHGIEELDMEKENITLLKELYPNGKAMGYKAGELRGMWSVTFDKKEFIKNM